MNEKHGRMIMPRVRKLESLGRVLIPIDMRRELNMDEGDMVEISIEGNGVRVAPAQPRCVFCGKITSAATAVLGKPVCSYCWKQLDKELTLREKDVNE